MEESTLMLLLTNLENKIDEIGKDVNEVSSDVKVLQAQVKELQDQTISFRTFGIWFRWLFSKKGMFFWIILLPLVNFLLSLKGLPSIPFMDGIKELLK